MQIIRSIAGSKDQNDTESEVNKSALRKVKRILKKKNIDKVERAAIIKMINEEITLSKRIKRLLTMQKLFKYWHVAHLPFALIMLIILVIHVAVTLAFGYKWIF
jgi:arginyl-tRNA--protein-N-Asp/Glu arginylyltransferase